MSKKHKILIIVVAILLIFLMIITLIDLIKPSEPNRIIRTYLIGTKIDDKELKKITDDNFFEKYQVNIYYKRNRKSVLANRRWSNRRCYKYNV